MVPRRSTSRSAVSLKTRTTTTSRKVELGSRYLVGVPLVGPRRDKGKDGFNVHTSRVSDCLCNLRDFSRDDPKDLPPRHQ